MDSLIKDIMKKVIIKSIIRIDLEGPITIVKYHVQAIIKKDAVRLAFVIFSKSTMLAYRHIPL